jgi:hypothetical protein
MKQRVLVVAAFLVLGASVVRLAQRWREERADRRLVLAADWTEIRDYAARQGISDEQLLERLHNAGANGLVLGPSVVGDFVAEGKGFANRSQAELAATQLLNRGVVGVSLHRAWAHYRLELPQARQERLKDIEAGFDPTMLSKSQAAGLPVVLRINQDPWLEKSKLFEELGRIVAGLAEMGILLNTEDVPGGRDSWPDWISFMRQNRVAHLLFEFRPTKSTLKMAYGDPQDTYRAHTIPVNELRELTEWQQGARWRRAVEERSCRFLLFHISPNATLPSFLENLYATRQDFLRRGWEMGWPKPRLTWSDPSGFDRRVGPWLALLMAILAPLLALRFGLRDNPWVSSAVIAGLTLLGACVVAAAAQNPFTRVEILPFRGVKTAFILSWIGCILWLYRGVDWKQVMNEPVRRMDVALGFVACAIVAYFLIRTGNAGSAWKAGNEQFVRERLEELLFIRPRFKEFVLGYPLLLFGLHLRDESKDGPFGLDARFWMAVGMIGPITTVNTFCHLHTPIVLAFWRSGMGWVLGMLLGSVLWGLWRWRIKTR